MKQEDFIKDCIAELTKKEKTRNTLNTEIKILKKIIAKGRGRP